MKKLDRSQVHSKWWNIRNKGCHKTIFPSICLLEAIFKLIKQSTLSYLIFVFQIFKMSLPKKLLNFDILKLFIVFLKIKPDLNYFYNFGKNELFLP